MSKKILFHRIKKRITDKRGYFQELYNKNFFLPNIHFVQDNYSFSKKKNTFRGFHYQEEPFSQSKLVFVIKGEILDLAIDLRNNSKTFMKTFKFKISDVDNKLLFIPNGFAHGFLTLKDDTEVFYKVDNFYSKKHERGINVKDPKFNFFSKGILNKLILSKKDREMPFF